MSKNLEKLISQYNELCSDEPKIYNKLYLYSIITQSTAIEGSTLTEEENLLLLDEGKSIIGKSDEEQYMNIDLKAAYKKGIALALEHKDYTTDMLIELSSLVMKSTGKEYKTALGDFSSSKGELRLFNVNTGFGGSSYMNYNKVPQKVKEFCEWLNLNRVKEMSVEEIYRLSFDAHYKLVTIHPWADGNGRMARLVMNMIQYEFNLLPTIVLKEDKEKYIKALKETRENENYEIFRNYMCSTIENYHNF